jgi:hypothetical protein
MVEKGKPRDRERNLTHKFQDVDGCGTLQVPINRSCIVRNGIAFMCKRKM